MSVAESPSDPYAATSAAAKVFVLGKYEREILTARWDGTRETARQIGEELGGVPTHRVVLWARELHLPHATNLIASVVEGSQLTDEEKTIVRSTYDLDVAGDKPTAPPAATSDDRKKHGARYTPEMRQRVASLKAEGRSYGEIAKMTGLSPATVAHLATYKPSAPEPQPKLEKKPTRLMAVPRPAPKPEPVPEPEPAAIAIATDPEPSEEAIDYQIVLELAALLPADGHWTAKQRERWLRAVTALVDLLVTIDGESG